MARQKLRDMLNSKASGAASPSPSASPVYGFANSPSSSYSNSASASPFQKSPWLNLPGIGIDCYDEAPTGLVGSLVREEGHVYSLAADGELLYTGSDSKNIRVWKDGREHGVFKSSSGLVKAIVIAGDRIFTGHQDGKIRTWRIEQQSDDATSYKRVGSLPTFKDFLTSSVNPKNYIRVRRHRNALWLRHFDAVSCLSLDATAGLLYSGSWDKTVKVWRMSDSKCLESIDAHDDAVNTVAAAGFDGLVLTGSADGTVKLWRRHGAEHVEVKTLIRGESAVTAIAVASDDRVIYSGASDGLVNFWEWRRRSAHHGGALRGHKLAVLCLAVAGPLVVSGSADKTLCVWRREEGVYGGTQHVKISVLAGHGGPVKCVAMERWFGAGDDEDDDDDHGYGGRRWVVYSGSLDKSVKVWRVRESGRNDVSDDSELTSLPAPLAVGGATLDKQSAAYVDQTARSRRA